MTIRTANVHFFPLNNEPMKIYVESIALTKNKKVALQNCDAIPASSHETEYTKPCRVSADRLVICFCLSILRN